MNSKVKRYDPINNDGTCGMCVEDADCGAYVEHADYAALEAECERLLAGRQMLIGDLERLDATVEMLRAELEGANERARILLDAKNHWAERARKAEAELAAIKGQEPVGVVHLRKGGGISMLQVELNTPLHPGTKLYILPAAPEGGEV